MGRCKIQRVVVHVTDDKRAKVLTDRVAEYHAEIIERRLSQSDLSAQQKIEVIERILVALRG